jgi:ferredoxin-NADP reductase
MSILRQAAHDRAPQPLALVYSNRRPEDAAFLAELQELHHANGRFKLIPTMTQMAKSSQPWKGETRFVDAPLLKGVLAELPDPISYLAGPPAMVDAMQRALADAGFDSDDVRTEEFAGY